MQDYVTYTLYRLEAVIREVDQLRDEDFAYRDVEDAVERIASIFRDYLRRLTRRKAPAVEDMRISLCLDALEDIGIYLPFLGVIIRSAATRNAFEMYGPIRSIARKLLNTPVRLIISSGWDYTPLTFRPIKRFEDYVIIVLPACESSNPLLIPLAGHELGHSVWQRENLRDSLEEVAALALVEQVRKTNDVVDFAVKLRKVSAGKARTLLERKTIVFAAALEWLLRQLEEMFCDFVGLYLFGESFAHAFSYFLSPDFPGPQSPKYPSVETRMAQLHRAAEAFEATWKSGNYVLSPEIRKAIRPLPPYIRAGSLIKLPVTPNPWRTAVDSVAISLVPSVIAKIVELGERTNWKDLRDFSDISRKSIVSNAFRWAVPASNARHLPNILNAAWDVERNPILWGRLPSISSLKKEESESRRREILRDLVLKNIEVFEYEKKCPGGA